MATTTTPRRSTRLPHAHTPKMSERKKSLFQGEGVPARESMTKHRNLPVLNSESDSEDCDLGIISTLDSSSSDENEQIGPKTPDRRVWHDTRSQSKKLIKENNELKSFIKSPFTLKKYQTRSSCPEKCSGSISTPVTPHIHNYPGTPSSTHSCTSVHTTSSSSSRARKSLADLIADTESCSSSLKDLNFDTDSGTDTKENTPTKSFRRSTRKKMTPKLSFKGILVEQMKNITPVKNPVVCLTKTDFSTILLPRTPENIVKLNENTKTASPAKSTDSSLTKMDMESTMSPTQMMKTPQNSSEAASPPRMIHRKSGVEIAESPESVDGGEKTNKRIHYDSMSEIGPAAKHPRLDFNSAPKARLSLFNSDRLKEMLCTKSFYGKSNPELNTSITAKISTAIEMTKSSNRRVFSHSHLHRRKKAPGQINSGVRHKIRKPKINKSKIIVLKGKSNLNNSAPAAMLNNSTLSNSTLNDTSMISQNSSQEMDKIDPFDKEKKTIDTLLSQWTEEEVPEEELIYSKSKKDISIFNSTIIEETNQIFQPVTAVPVDTELLSSQIHSQNTETVIVELGGQNQKTNEVTVSSSPMPDVVMSEAGHSDTHGEIPKNGHFLPVEGGYILVEGGEQVQEDLPDLDEIERELKMLDEQILRMAESNNINPQVVIASTEGTVPVENETSSDKLTEDNAEKSKLFPIFKNPNPGITTPNTKEKSKKIIKTGMDQYVIDAGQKKFGATQCTECGVIYQIGDPQDEHDHLVHHNASDVLKFNGWKDECVIERSETSRIVRVRGGDQGWKKVLALLQRVIHPQLGYSSELPKSTMHYTAYLYIEKKQIIGCLIAEPKTKAHKLIPGEPDCCSVESYPVKCGISRIWTHANHRHRGIARQLLNCTRVSFLYGNALAASDLAFSAPTQAGKALATKYCATENFYVYLE